MSAFDLAFEFAGDILDVEGTWAEANDSLQRRGPGAVPLSAPADDIFERRS